MVLWCGGHGLSKIVFLGLNDSATIWPIELIFLVKLCKSFSVIVPSFMVLAHGNLNNGR